MNNTIYDRALNNYNDIGCLIAHEYSQSQLSMKSVDINCFTRLPNIGEYILSKCRTKAYRVLRHQKAVGCGHQCHVVFVSDETNITIENQHGDNGIEIHVHNNQCGDHCISVCYLAMPKGYNINATLL